MGYLICDDETLEDRPEAWARYRTYLASIRALMPVGAREFTDAPWHYQMDDHRCPHDSWLISFSMDEVEVGSTQQHRAVNINLQLLGAYQDGMILVHYDRVISYCLTHRLGIVPRIARANEGHGDWIIDEISLSSSGAVVHEIAFAHGARWKIECNDVRCSWHPLSDK